MPEPEWIEIQKDLAALTARVEAFEQAQKRAEEEEPRALSEVQIDYVESGGYEGKLMIGLSKRAARRLRWCEYELARLREGLNLNRANLCGGLHDDNIEYWSKGDTGLNDIAPERASEFAREIQRHRALVGGGK